MSVLGSIVLQLISLVADAIFWGVSSFSPTERKLWWFKRGIHLASQEICFATHPVGESNVRAVHTKSYSITHEENILTQTNESVWKLDFLLFIS